MRGETESRPKCMIELEGKPLLHWQLDALTAAGIRHITVVGGYMKEKLTGEFNLLVNPRWAETNMVSTLACAGDILRREQCLISYSDIVYQPAHVTALMANPEDIAITYDVLWRSLWTARSDTPLADAETFREENGLLLEIGARAQSLDDIRGQYMGLVKTTPSGYRIIDDYLEKTGDKRRDAMDMTSLLSALVKQSIRIGAVPVRGGWVECDCQHDLEVYSKALAEAAERGALWAHDWRRQEPEKGRR